MQANYKRFSLAWIAGKKQEENRRCFGRVSALEARSTGVRYDDGGFSGRLKVAIAVLAPQLQRGRLRAPLSRKRSHHHPGSTHGGSGMVREATGRDNPKRRGQAAFPRNPADFRRVPTGPMRPILQNPPPWEAIESPGEDLCHMVAQCSTTFSIDNATVNRYELPGTVGQMRICASMTHRPRRNHPTRMAGIELRALPFQSDRRNPEL